MLFIIIFTAALAILTYHYLKFREMVRKYPPGPPPLPFIGNILEMDINKLQEYFERCHRSYGSVFTVFVPNPLVVLMEYEDIKEAFVTNGESFIGRTGKYPDTLQQITENGGIIFAQGDVWRENRRHALHILRDLGLGKNVMEHQILDSIHHFTNHLDSLADKDRVNFRWPIQVLVANVINYVLYSYHYPYENCERLMDFCDRINWQIEKIRADKVMFLFSQFPLIQNIPFLDRFITGPYFANSRKMFNHITVDVQKCMESYSEDEPTDCFVHAYHRKTGRNPATDLQMINVCSDLFLAGMETTSTTLRWGAIFMAKYPEVQEKIRQEIYSVVGRDRLVVMADKAALPYTSAAVHELQRCANIIPVNVLHVCTEDTQVGGHKIPANSIINGQIYNVLKDDEHFGGEREEFKPERFLEADGKTINKKVLDHLVPFSMGKRICVGEGLARMELFLCFSALIQRYRIEPPIDGPLNTTAIPGGVCLPPPNLFKITKLC